MRCKQRKIVIHRLSNNDLFGKSAVFSLVFFHECKKLKKTLRSFAKTGKTKTLVTNKAMGTLSREFFFASVHPGYKSE